MCLISVKARRGYVPVSPSICPLVMRRGGEGEELSESLFIASISAEGMRRLACGKGYLNTYRRTCFGWVPHVRICPDTDHDIHQLQSVTLFESGMAWPITISLLRCKLTGMPESV